MLDSFSKRKQFKDQPSSILNSSFGLFSHKKPFKRFHKLGRYTGRKIKSGKLERLYKGFMPPNSICKGNDANSICIDANWSLDGLLHYANNIRSKARTNIRIKDTSKNIKNKFTLMGYTLKCIRPNTELFNFYGKHWKKT